MKKYLIISLALVGALTSCRDTDIDLFDSPLTEAGSGTLANTAATISTLEFSWQAVDGVHQYGYTLLDARNTAVRQGITRDTKVRFENLETATAYTLEVEAYGANGAPTQKFSLTAATDEIHRLSTPDTDNTAMDIDDDGKVTITWPAVSGADYYEYALEKSDGTAILDGTTTDTHVTFNSMRMGDYVLCITAYSDYEGYLASETAEYAFKRPPRVTATYTGTYTSAVLGSFSCTMKTYEDDSNVIENFLGVDGYNLVFNVSSTRVVTFLNHFKEDGTLRYVATGLTEFPTMIIDEDPSKCSYSALPSGKRIKMYVMMGEGAVGDYDTFTWK